jgi:hypothetical protein
MLAGLAPAGMAASFAARSKYEELNLKRGRYRDRCQGDFDWVDMISVKCLTLA